MNAALQLIKPTSLEAEAQAAVTESARLLDAVRAADSAAQRATDLFEIDPNADTHAGSAVAQQLAKKARKIHDEYVERTASVIERARLETNTTALDALLAQIQRDRTIAAQRDRIAEILADARVRLRGAIVDLDVVLAQYNSVCDRATHLARSVGRTDVYRHVERKHAIAAVNDGLHGPNQDYAQTRTTLVMSDFDPNRFELFIADVVGANK